VYLWNTDLVKQKPNVAVVVVEVMKKRSERRKHCMLAVARWNQNFLTHRRPPSRGRWTAKI